MNGAMRRTGLLAAVVAVSAVTFARAQRDLPPRTLSQPAQAGTPFVEEERDLPPELFGGRDFAVVIPEIRDGRLTLSLTPWAETVILPGLPAVGPPWWDPMANPPGALVFTY